MRKKALEISNIVDGSLKGNADKIITGAAGLLDAGPDDVSFIGNPKYINLVSETKAGLILVGKELENIGRDVVIVKNPQLAFAKLLKIIEAERLSYNTEGIHSTAVISSSAIIEKNVYIGPYVVIEANAKVGESTRILAHSYIGYGSKVGKNSLIYPNVTIRENIVVGNNAIIHSGTVIGSDGFGFIPQAEGHFKIPQIGGVEIGDDVEIGANVAIDRATTGNTKIGNGTKIDNLVHIAHNVQFGEKCLITGQVGFAGSTKIGNFVTFGAQSGAAGHLTIGDGAIIAARGGVTRDIKPKEVVSGFPARTHRDELKIGALINKLPELYAFYKKKINRE